MFCGCHGDVAPIEGTSSPKRWHELSFGPFLCRGCRIDASTHLTRRGGVVGVGGGCIGLRSLFNKKFMLVIKKKERKRKKNLPRGLRRVSSPRSTSLVAVVMT